MKLASEPVEVKVLELKDVSPAPAGGRRFDLIRQRGTLRVGYRRDLLPFMFQNAQGQMVGFDAEMAHQLARDLGVKSEIPEVPSIALGVAQVTLHEMVAANSALVNHGMYIEPIIITRIEDKSGNKIYDANDHLVIDQVHLTIGHQHVLWAVISVDEAR